MARTNALPGLLMALAAMPLVAGCAVLGLPPTGETLDAQPAAGVDNSGSTPAPAASPSAFSSNDGYALILPPGWVGVKTNSSASAAALDLLSATDAALGDEARSIMDDTGARMSMIGTEPAEVGVVAVPPGIAILVMSTSGSSDNETQKRISGIVNGLTTLDGPVDHSVVSVAAGDAHRYDLAISGDSLSIQARVYLFTVGDDGVVILFGSDPTLAATAGPDMDSIIKSLRFGV
jgi:hypothetical protein